MNDAVSVVIPDAKNAEQATENAEAVHLASSSPNVMTAAKPIHDERIAAHVHHRW